MLTVQGQERKAAGTEMSWIALALRVVPLVFGAIQGAEAKFPGRGRGSEKQADVIGTVVPVVDEVLGVSSTSDQRYAEIRKAVAWTVDAAVAWMKVFGVL